MEKLLHHSFGKSLILSILISMPIEELYNIIKNKKNMELNMIKIGNLLKVTKLTLLMQYLNINLNLLIKKRITEILPQEKLILVQKILQQLVKNWVLVLELLAICSVKCLSGLKMIMIDLEN